MRHQQRCLGLYPKTADPQESDADPENLKSASKERLVTEARRVFCYIAVRKLGYKCTEVSKEMTISAVTVSKAVSLGSRFPEVDKIQK